MMEATGACLGARQHDLTTANYLDDGTLIAIREDGTIFICRNINDIEDIEADEMRRQEQKRFAYLTQ